MKIRINYDFFDKIKDANEDKPTVFTLIRNNKHIFILETLVLMFIEFLNYRLLPPPSPFDHFVFVFLAYRTLICEKIAGSLLFKKENINIYKEDAIVKLLELLKQLKKLYLNTDYQLLLKTELYKHEYSLKFKDGIPRIIEKKYFNVPAYGFNNQIKTRSVLQEHVIGSRYYDLSLDEPVKKFKLVLAQENI